MPSESLADVVRFCAIECHLQGSGELSVWHMFRAWEWAVRRSGDDVQPDEEAVLTLGRLVEPEKNDGGYRQVGVRVGHDVKPDWQLVPRQMTLLVAEADNLEPAEWFRQFEEVHPFRDGNGRTGALLFNWLNWSLDKPVWPPNFWNDPRRREGFGA